MVRVADEGLTVVLRASIMVVAAILLSACAPAGVKNVEVVQFDRSKTIEKPFDQVWADTVDWFASLGIPIDKIQKDSGLISSTWGGTTTNQTYISCGDPTGNIGLYRGRFIDMSIDINILVRPDGQHAKATINVFGNAVVDVSNAFGSVSRNRVQCESRGVLERNYFGHLGV